MFYPQKGIHQYTKMLPQDSTWHGFSDKGKMATGLVLGHVVHDKTKALCHGCSRLNFPLPQPKNNGKTGTSKT